MKNLLAGAREMADRINNSGIKEVNVTDRGGLSVAHGCRLVEMIGNGDVESFQKQVERHAWKDEVVDAARKFVNCKGRYHSEQNMTALIELFKQEPKL